MEEKTYLVRIETRHFWRDDLVFETRARNSQHAIVKTAQAFERVCRRMGLEECVVDDTPLKYLELAYHATQLPDLDTGLEEMLATIGDATWR